MNISSTMHLNNLISFFLNNFVCFVTYFVQGNEQYITHALCNTSHMGCAIHHTCVVQYITHALCNTAHMRYAIHHTCVVQYITHAMCNTSHMNSFSNNLCCFVCRTQRLCKECNDITI